MTIHEMLQWRYATQQFNTSKNVSEDDLNYILEAANLAATSYGLQPFGIVVVNDQALKEQLVEASFGQQKVADNSALLVFCARTNVDEAFIAEYTDRVARERSIDPSTLAGFKEMMIGDLTSRTPEERLTWAQKQSYIALGTAMVAAAERGVDGAPMEGFRPTEFNNILGLAEHNLHATSLFAVGYRSAEDERQYEKKVRRPLEDTVVRM